MTTPDDLMVTYIRSLMAVSWVSPKTPATHSPLSTATAWMDISNVTTTDSGNGPI